MSNAILSSQSYRVRANDSVDKIAARHGVSRQDIVDANPALSRNVDLIHIGQVLQIPGQSGRSEGGTSTASAPAPSAPESYTIRRGDNLSVIAKRTGVSVDDLRRLNRGTIGRNDLIHPNQKLVLREAVTAEDRPQPRPTDERPVDASTTGPAPASRDGADQPAAVPPQQPAVAAEQAEQPVVASPTQPAATPVEEPVEAPTEAPLDQPATAGERLETLATGGQPAAAPTGTGQTTAGFPITGGDTTESAPTVTPRMSTQGASTLPSLAAPFTPAEQPLPQSQAPAGSPVLTDAPQSQAAAPISLGTVPSAVPAHDDAFRVANAEAPKTIDIDGFGTLLNGGRLNVSSLVADDELRRLAGDVAISGLEKNGAGAAARVPSSVQKASGIDEATLRRFRREGLGALTPEQQGQLRTALGDNALAELRRLGGQSGIIEARRAREVFGWLDRFDTNGNSETIAMATEAGGGNPARLTPAGRAMARIVATQTAEKSFTELDFVAGFRNGVIDAQKLLNDPNARRVLQDAGILDSLVQSVSNGQNVQLTVPQLRALYRLVDKPDTNGSGDSFIARNGGNLNSEVPVPFAIPPSTQAPTESGRIVSALNSIFKSNHVAAEGDDPASVYDVPPSVGNETEALLRDVGPRLSERQSVDSTTFREFMRDARIDLSKLTPEETAALASAGVSVERLRALASPDSKIGGPNGDMAKLYELLRGAHRPASRTIRPYAEGNAFLRTNVGTALEILERHTERYTLMTQERFAEEMRGTKIDLAVLDKPIEGDPTGRTPRQALTDGGFDVAGFETWVKANPARLRGANAAPKLWEMLRSSGAYPDPRPGTIATGVTRYGAGGADEDSTKAGDVIAGLTISGLVHVDEQQPRSYENALGAMQAPAGARAVSIPFRHYVMRGRTDCMYRVGDLIRSGPKGRNISTSGQGSWLATRDDSSGRIAAARDDLVAARRYIDAMLDRGELVGVGVARKGGANLNFDDITDHYVTVVGRGTDEQGRLYYSYADSAKTYVGRFYVDPRTELLFAPRDAEYTVGNGGYQVTHVRAFAERGWADEYTRLSGRAPRSY